VGAKISVYDDLNKKQRVQLLAVLMKYHSHRTKRPRKCTGLDYDFNIVGTLLKSGCSRAIPFALCNKVEAQIQDMLYDGILEESYSDYVNPLTLEHRERKPLRLRVDARGVNIQMTPDRVEIALIRELLQRFHGSKYITTLYNLRTRIDCNSLRSPAI
jgi:hypothetical protein